MGGSGLFYGRWWMLPFSPAVPGLPHALWIDFKQRRSGPRKTVRFPIGFAFGAILAALACWGLSSATGLQWAAADVGLGVKAGSFLAANAGSALALSMVTQKPPEGVFEVVFEALGAVLEGLGSIDP